MKSQHSLWCFYNKEGRLVWFVKEARFFQWGWPSNGAGCPERLWNLPPWRLKSRLGQPALGGLAWAEELDKLTKMYKFIENSITCNSFLLYLLHGFLLTVNRFLYRTLFVTVEFMTRIPKLWYLSYSKKWCGLVERQAVLLLRGYLPLQLLLMLDQKIGLWIVTKNPLPSLTFQL